MNSDFQNAIDTDEPVPSATLKVIATGAFSNLDVFIDNMLSNIQIGQGPTTEEGDSRKIHSKKYPLKSKLIFYS